MKRSAIFFFGLLLLGGSLGVRATLAQTSGTDTKGTNSSADKGTVSGAATGVAILNQAGDLVRYARETQSPVAMLAAVQMINRVQYQQSSDRVGAKKTDQATTPARGSADAKAKNPEITYDTQKLLAEAKGWAKGNPQLLALINTEANKHAASGSLGAGAGAIVHHDTVLARHYDDYAITFVGGELARVAVVGDGDTDLDLYIYDENGNLITSDTDYTDQCLVEFTPRWTGAFRVRVVNNGYVYNNYVLLTN
jgi:hypothetical protein